MSLSEPKPEPSAIDGTTEVDLVDDTTQPAVNSPEPPKPRKKSVGFSALPEEDLREHHRTIKKKEVERAKSNPFHRIPPELAYLEKRNTPYPKPIVQHDPFPVSNKKPGKELGDLRNMPIKVISIANQETEINFDYPTIHLPIQQGNVMVNVKYAGLNSRDLFKIYQFGLNLSNKKIGLGYEFVGEVQILNNENFDVGDKVVGIVHPNDKKGSLSTSLLINPAYDVLLRVDDEMLEKLNSIDISLSFSEKQAKDGDFEIDSDSEEASKTEVETPPAEEPKKPSYRKKHLFNYEIPDELPNLGKLVTYPSLYCRASQILSHIKNNGIDSVNVLINGADTNLGYTLLQILSTKYAKSNIILVVRESSAKEVQYMVNNLPYDPSVSCKINVIPFDVENNDIILKNEKIPVHYKKPDFIAIEIIEALFSIRSETDEKINFKNLEKFQLDLFIDLIGCKKLFQKNVKFENIDEIQLPLHEHVLEPVTTLFHGQVNEPFFAKLLKPKGRGSAVSGCRFDVSVPTYSITNLFQQQSVWNKIWGNTFSGYSWYDEINIRIQPEWMEEGLQMMLNGRLKFKVDHVVDWRNKHTKSYMKELKEKDHKLVLSVEEF